MAVWVSLVVQSSVYRLPFCSVILQHSALQFATVCTVTECCKLEHRKPSLYSLSGCWFGDPKSQNRVWMPGVDPCNVAAADTGSTPTAFVHGLLALLFTKDELKSGCLTKPMRADISQLDQAKVHSIRGIGYVLGFEARYTSLTAFLPCFVM